MNSVRWRTALGVLALAAVAAGCGAGDAVGSPPATEAPVDPSGGIPPAVQAVLDDPIFAHSSIGLLVTDGETGEVLVDLRSQEVFEAGSTTKLFSTAAALDAYGADHRFVTPVHHTGTLDGGVVDGDLVLVASGDQNLGGRGVLDGPIQFVPTDHTYPQLPGAAITPGDPLAGLKDLAAQVVASGVTEVLGDVIVDDRLFETFTGWEQSPISPIVLNDNEIDVLSYPTTVGEAATLEWRPHVPGWSVRSEVTTVAAGEGSAVEVAEEAPGQLVVSGTVEEGGGPVLGGWFVADPAAFARSAFIAELQAAGVAVAADPVGPNPSADLPDEPYGADTLVAELPSAPLSETVHLVLKVSHNWGAELLTCMVAVANGSKDCTDGLRAEYAMAEAAGLDPASMFILDGAGSSLSRFSPETFVKLVEWSTTQPWADVYHEALPVLGESGDLDLFGQGSPAQGKVQAKTGTRAVPDPGADRFLLQTRTMVGFIDARSGRQLHFALLVENSAFASVDELFAFLDEVVDITVALYESY